MTASPDLSGAFKTRTNTVSEVIGSSGEPMTRVLDRLQASLLGETVKTTYSRRDSNREVSIDTNIAALITNPIQDLKSLAPQYNRCGDVVSVADDTLDGLYPNGSRNRMIKAQTAP